MIQEVGEGSRSGLCKELKDAWKGCHGWQEASLALVPKGTPDPQQDFGKLLLTGPVGSSLSYHVRNSFYKHVSKRKIPPSAPHWEGICRHQSSTFTGEPGVVPAPLSVGLTLWARAFQSPNWYWEFPLACLSSAPVHIWASQASPWYPPVPSFRLQGKSNHSGAPQQGTARHAVERQTVQGEVKAGFLPAGSVRPYVVS